MSNFIHSNPDRHSGESRNPERQFHGLDSGFRRNDDEEKTSRGVWDDNFEVDMG